ncbi:hypothetical protein EK21DRAFT_83199, partial [Setomelanomma holmii]
CYHFHIIFTDGACTNNGRSGARPRVGIPYSDDISSQLSIPITDTKDNFALRSNQRAELCAAKIGLDLLAQARNNQPKSEANAWIVATDSEYVVKGITEWYQHGRYRNNWRTSKDNKPTNLDLFLALDGAMTKHETA